MSKYSYITDKTHNDRKIQVESAKRDGKGKNIENNYAKQSGYYGSMAVGLSNNFDTKLVMVDESAYNFRPTASMGSRQLEVGSPCKVKKIIGGTIVFNQLVQNGNFADTNYWGTDNASLSVLNNVGTITMSAGDYPRIGQIVSIISNHKYLLSFSAKSSDLSEIMISGATSWHFKEISSSWTQVTEVTSSPQTGSQTLVFGGGANITQGSVIEIKDINFIDLTQMFGSTIADYIYSLEQANAGSGVAWFKRYFPKEYYAYNSGELVSVKTQGKKITHFNQWDEEWENGEYNIIGEKVSANDRIINKNPIIVLPNTTYYLKLKQGQTTGDIFFYDENMTFISYEPNKGNTTFVTPNNCRYINFCGMGAYGSTYNHDICINFHYDGERDGEYEPYESETYPCDDIELRGMPKTDLQGNLYFEGDEYAYDGSVKRKYGIVDLGDLEWEYLSNGIFRSKPFAGIKDGSKGLCTKYAVDSASWYTDLIDKTLYTLWSWDTGTIPQIVVVDTDFSDATAFKNSLSGVYLVYELATPTDENSIPFTEVQECDNWGTEEWLAPTTDTRPCEVPVGHETDYLPDLKAKLEVAPSTPNENGVYVMEHNASGNSYTPIATWLANNGYKTEETMKDTFGMKDALGGTLRQCLCVKESLGFDNTTYIDLGSLEWTRTTSYTNPFFYAYISNRKTGENNNLMSSLYNKLSSTFSSQFGDNAPNMSVCFAIDVGSGQVFIRNDDYTDATAFKNAMKGVLLAYEKAS